MYRKKLFDKYLTSIYLAHHKTDPKYWPLSGYDYAFAKLLPRDMTANILDIGCGTGEFLYYLKNKGYQDVIGVDVSAEAIALCNNNKINNAKLITNLEKFLIQKNKYEVIFLNDVLEHISKEKIIDILQSIYNGLTLSGYLVIKTPNAASFTSVYARYQDFTHEVIFTEQSLRQILNVSGFKKITIGGEENMHPFKRLLLRKVLNSIYWLERGGLFNPTIYESNLIGIARR